MSVVTEVDFAVAEGDDVMGLPTNTVVEFPPVFTTDVASKAYADAPIGEAGAFYSGYLNFDIPGSILQGETFPPLVLFSVDRNGNIVTLRLGQIRATVMVAGDSMLATGLPKQFWPLPTGPLTGSDVVVGSGCLYGQTVSVELGNPVYDGSLLGVRSDGLVQIKLLRTLNPGAIFACRGGALSYLTNNVAP